MDLLKDLAQIVKNDKTHNLIAKVDGEGITVFLDYDSNLNYAHVETEIIPIRYDTLEEFCYIPMDELKESFHTDEYGINSDEIKLISQIMDYLESHTKEISDICDMYDLESRKEIAKEDVNFPPYL